MALREQKPELSHSRLKVVPAVGETAAADHQITQTREVCLTNMFIPVTDFFHGHARKRQDAINDSLQRCRHAVAIEGEAQNKQVAAQNFLQNCFHIILMNAGAAIMHTGEAACAIFNMQVNGVEHVYLLISDFPHPCQKSTGNAEGVAFLFFGTAVQYQYFHIVFSQMSFTESCQPFRSRRIRTSSCHPVSLERKPLGFRPYSTKPTLS